MRKDKEGPASLKMSTKVTFPALAYATVACLRKRHSEILHVVLQAMMYEAIVLLPVILYLAFVSGGLFCTNTTGLNDSIAIMVFKYVSSELAFVIPPFLFTLGLAFSSQRILLLVSLPETRPSLINNFTDAQYKRLYLASLWLALFTTAMYGACMIPAFTVEYLSIKGVSENNHTIEWAYQFTVYSSLFAIIPACLAFSRKVYALSAIADQDASYFESFRISRQITHGNRISTFLGMFLIGWLGICVPQIILWFTMTQTWSTSVFCSCLIFLLAHGILIIYFLLPLLFTFLNVSYLMMTGRKTIADMADAEEACRDNLRESSN